MHDDNPYGDLQLADLDDGVGGAGGSGGPRAQADEADEFADAELDSEPPRAEPGGYGDVAGVTPGGAGAELQLDTPGPAPGGDRGLATKQQPKTSNVVPTAPGLVNRGATSVGAMVPTGATPAGHKQSRRGLIFPYALENTIACFIVGLVVALLPARVVSASHLDSVGVEAALESMEQGHTAIATLLDDERTDTGPQTIDAVAVALGDEVAALDSTAAEVDEAIASAKSRYWVVWGGIGLPLGLALSLLRRR